MIKSRSVHLFTDIPQSILSFKLVVTVDYEPPVPTVSRGSLMTLLRNTTVLKL